MNSFSQIYCLKYTVSFNGVIHLILSGFMTANVFIEKLAT